MALRQFSARGLIGVLAAGLLMAGCTPDPRPRPSVSPTAATSTPGPTRSETAEETKEREALESAEMAYRTGFEEVGRLAMEGGADKPTKVMTSTMTGSFLSYQMDLLRSIRKDQVKASSPGVLARVRLEAYSPTTLRLETCEDYRGVHLVESSGATATPDENTGTRVYRQLITMQLIKGSWKSSELETAEKVESCDS